MNMYAPSLSVLGGYFHYNKTDWETKKLLDRQRLPCMHNNYIIIHAVSQK